MAKFSESFFESLRGAGRRGSPTDPMLQRQAGPQYGSTDPLARSLGGMLGMDMRTAPELATAELSTFQAQNPKASAQEALRQSILTQAKYEQDPQKKMLMLAKLAELEQTTQNQTAQQNLINGLIIRAKNANLPDVADNLRQGRISIEEAQKAIQETQVTSQQQEKNIRLRQSAIPILKNAGFADLASLVETGFYDDNWKELTKIIEERKKPSAANDSRTSEMKNWQTLNEDRVQNGLPSMSFEDFLNRKSNNGTTATGLQQEHAADIAANLIPETMSLADYDLYRKGHINKDGTPKEKTTAESTQKDSEGFLRFVSGPNAGRYVYPDSVKEVKEKKLELERVEREKIKNTVDVLKKSGFERLAANLELGIITQAQALADSKLPPEIIKEMNIITEQNSNLTENAKNAAALLINYNENVPISGVPAGAIREAGRWFGKSDKPTENLINYNKLRMVEVLKLLPPGSTTERELFETLKTAPAPTDAPEIIRKYIHAAAKANALAAAERNERLKWMKNNAGDMSGYQEHFLNLVKDVGTGEVSPYIQKVYKDYGIPPTPFFKKKTSSSLK